MDRKAGISLALGIGLSLAGQVLSRVLERVGLGILAYMVLGISGLVLLHTWHAIPRRRDIGLLFRGMGLALVCIGAVLGICLLFSGRIQPGPGIDWLWFPAVCLGALWEESVHRGLILPALRVLDRWPAIFLGAAWFAICHGSGMSVTHMLCGTLLGLCATDTDSVWTGIGFHALWNMLGLVLGRVYVLHGPAEQAEWAVLVCTCIVMALRLKRKEDEHV